MAPSDLRPMVAHFNDRRVPSHALAARASSGAGTPPPAAMMNISDTSLSGRLSMASQTCAERSSAMATSSVWAVRRSAMVASSRAIRRRSVRQRSTARRQVILVSHDRNRLRSRSWPKRRNARAKASCATSSASARFRRTLYAMLKARPDESRSRSSNSRSRPASELTRLSGQRPTHSFMCVRRQDGADTDSVHPGKISGPGRSRTLFIICGRACGRATAGIHSAPPRFPESVALPRKLRAPASALG